MKRLIVLSLIIYSIAPVDIAWAAKCDKYKNKLNKIQSMQRQANSVSKSNKLKEKEHKAFLLWRKCQQGKLKK